MTERQRVFLAAYLANPPARRNATRAAASAGYTWPEKQGPRLKTFPEIAEAIRAEDQRRRAERRAEDRRERQRERRRWHAENPWYRAGTKPPPLPRSVIRRRAKLWARLDAKRAASGNSLGSPEGADCM